MSEGKCPDCYGEGMSRWFEPNSTVCPTCSGSGLVSDELLAQREAEYHAWLRKRKKVKA